MRRAISCFCLMVVTGAARAEVCTEAGTDDGARQCFDAARHCTSIASDAERLVCFDSVYAGQASIAATADDGTAPVELSASPQEFAARADDRPRSARIESTIVGITTNAHDIDFLTLANGHTWRENEDSRVRFSTGRKVTIEEGMFGSFNLTMEGAPRSVKVKRVE